MSYKTFVSMNIAVIGAGTHTENFATSYALAGHEVFIAWKSGNSTTTRPSMRICDNVNICTIEEAAEVADVIVISSMPKDVREIAYWLGDARGKLIIDATANVGYPAEEHVNTLGAIRAITGSSYIVKVFCTRGYEQLLKPLLKHDEPQWLMVSDSKKAKEAAKILARDMGVSRFVDLGGADAIALFDGMTNCWRSLAGKNQGTGACSAK